MTSDRMQTASVQEENASKNDLLKLRMEVIDREVTVKLRSRTILFCVLLGIRDSVYD